MDRVENLNGTWAARYAIELQVSDIGHRSRVAGALWPAIWRELNEAGLAWGMTPYEAGAPEVPESVAGTAVLVEPL